MEFEFDLLRHVLDYARSNTEYVDETLVWCGIVNRLTRHKLFSFRWCKRMPHLPWDPALVSRHVTRLDSILKNPGFPWVFGIRGLSSNLNVTPTWVSRIPHAGWNVAADFSTQYPTKLPPRPTSYYEVLRWMTHPANTYERERRLAWNKRTAALAVVVPLCPRVAQTILLFLH